MTKKGTQVPMVASHTGSAAARCAVFPAAQGGALYVPEKEALVWKLKSFPGGREFLLRCKFGLPSVEAEDEPTGRMPPIRVSFEIPYFTVSGIQVRVCLSDCLVLKPFCFVRYRHNSVAGQGGRMVRVRLRDLCPCCRCGT
jgi:Adaptor complexes medium subunit family